jgi:transcriptional regulator with XRE-family HTH domain
MRDLGGATMTVAGDWAVASARLRDAIVARSGTLAEFARRLGMDPTQLTATLRPHRRPAPETLDRFSDVLGWPPAELRQWYGYELPRADAPEAPATPARWLPDLDDHELTDAEVVAAIKALPGRSYRREIAELEAELTAADFAAECRDIYRAWRSNAHLAIRSARRGR